MTGKKDRDREAFAGLFAKTVWFTVERTGVRARPFRLIFWSERNRKQQPIHMMMMTSQDMIELSDMILEALKELK